MKTKKKRNKRLLFSRFTIIALSIILQAAAMWILFYELASRLWWSSIIGYILMGAILAYIINRDNAAVYKLPWIIVCLLFPFAGCMCYLTFGNLKLSRKQARKYRAIYNEHHEAMYNQKEVLAALEENAPDKCGTFKYLRNATSLPVYNDSRVTYLKTGEEYFGQLCKQLLKAEKYIFLEYFIIEEGAMWNGIHEILLKKIASGVNVYLMYDDVGSVFKVSSGFYKKLRAEGIDARKFNKFVPIVSICHNNRDHRKIAVIDGKVAFTGGVNIADEYINVTHPYGRWLDSGIMVEGTAADSFVRLFIQLFNMSGKELKEDDFICSSHEKFDGNGFVMPFGDSPAPITYEHISEKTFMNAIYGAKKYIYFAAPYFIVDNDISDALINAARRGVDVRLIIPQKPDKKTVYVLTRYGCSRLLDAGVKIYFYRDGFVHSKTMVCDDEIAFSGTVNLDFRSFVHHFECGAVFTCKDAISVIYNDFCTLFKEQCVAADKKSLKLNPFETVIKYLMTPFAPLV